MRNDAAGGVIWDAAAFLLKATGLMAAGALSLLVFAFPYDSDEPVPPSEASKARAFYAAAYDAQASAAVSPEEERYARLAREAAEQWHVKNQVADFCGKYGVRKLLDVGSGQGYLQDVVQDYTGLDIAPTVARYYHKRFVLGSATSMPFPDNSFDGVASIWVLEHVPNPEAALNEIRRVAKDGGVLFLAPQWGCRAWQADGYDVRPYSDFGVRGKLVKASIPARDVLATMARPVVRGARAASWELWKRPTVFRYGRLIPNFKTYWEPDSDAVNSLDFYEMALWFRSRGDECLSCEAGSAWLTQTGMAVVVRVHKLKG